MRSDPTTPAKADCCASARKLAEQPGKSSTQRLGLFSSLGAVLSAMLSSACCWLPLLLLAFGASAGSVASLFEEYRFVFLPLTSTLLGFSFYLVYFRAKRCEPGSDCEIPRRGPTRFNRVSIWLATVIVLTFALFPNYVGVILRANEEPATKLEDTGDLEFAIRIDGMSCEGCVPALESKIRMVPGVGALRVDYSSSLARVRLGERNQLEAVLAAIAAQGFKAELDFSSSTTPGS